MQNKHDFTSDPKDYNNFPPNKRHQRNYFPPDKGDQGNYFPPDKGDQGNYFPPDKGDQGGYKGGYIPYYCNLTEKARINRKNPTEAESKIWQQLLSQKGLAGYKFTRQKPIDCFILDFYCSKLLLGIEIDGGSHLEKQEYDEERTKILNDFGIEVIRYTNNEVLSNIDYVRDDLSKKIEQRKLKMVMES